MTTKIRVAVIVSAFLLIIIAILVTHKSWVPAGVMTGLLGYFLYTIKSIKE